MKLFIFLILATYFSSFAFADDEICGRLESSDCSNGPCYYNIVPNTGAPIPVKLVIDDVNILTIVTGKVIRNDGSIVCVQGQKDEAGAFHVSSIYEK